MEQSPDQSHKRVVVIAVDESEYAENALKWYVKQVKRDDDMLVFAHCPEIFDYKEEELAERQIKEKEHQAGKVETKYKGLLQELAPTLAWKMRTVGGKPGEVVCKVAVEEKATIIVCGTRGQGKIRRTLIGSVSDYIVHHATVPVLVCRHRQ